MKVGGYSRELKGNCEFHDLMIKLFTVILNFNGGKDTIKCLDSLKKADTRGIEHQVVVVDNASNGGVHGIRKFKWVKIIENRENLGFTGGNNIGIKHALQEGADFVMILNNDTILDKSTILQLVKVAEKRTDAGIFSPKIYFAQGFEFHKKQYKKDERGKVLWYAGGRIDWDNVLGSNRGVDEVDIGRYNRISETDFATGACMLIRREVLEQVGVFDDKYFLFFDEKYFMYLEDADLSQRTREAGWKVLYVPDSHLWHKVAGSSAIGSDLNDYFITRNRMLFGMCYASLRAKFALVRESVKLFISGRQWQRQGIIDFYLGKFGKGSWK